MRRAESELPARSDSGPIRKSSPSAGPTRAVTRRARRLLADLRSTALMDSCCRIAAKPSPGRPRPAAPAKRERRGEAENDDDGRDKVQPHERDGTRAVGAIARADHRDGESG